MQLATTLLVFLFIGYRIDKWKSTFPWGTLIGAILGIVLGLYNFLQRYIQK